MSSEMHRGRLWIVSQPLWLRRRIRGEAAVVYLQPCWLPAGQRLLCTSGGSSRRRRRSRRPPAFWGLGSLGGAHPFPLAMLIV